MSRTSVAPSPEQAPVEPSAAAARDAVDLEAHVPGPQHMAERQRAPADEPAPPAGLRTGRPIAREGRVVLVEVRGPGAGEIGAAIAPGVEPELVDEAIERGDVVLVEVWPGEPPLVVGVLATRRTGTAVVKADRVVVEGREEVLLRAGSAAIRLRSDGDLELVGSRISATSRGLFRLVGRLLRLN